MQCEHARIPEELKNQIISNKKNYHAVDSKFTRDILKTLNLNTVCESALCPNRGKCFKDRVATFLILGKDCTRGCSFCAVDRQKPLPPDDNEIENIAKAVCELKLKYVILTSPTRDDLNDGGAEHYSKIIMRLNEMNPELKIEALIPDFAGSIDSLRTVVKTQGLTVLSHNLETVPSLYSKVRKGADYKRSLNVIENVKYISKSVYSKSGIMVGLGENEDEVAALMKDLRAVDCDILTIGQYIAPSIHHYPIYEYVPEKQFKKYEEIAYKLGFKAVASSALVRSSYLAETTFNNMKF